MAIQFHRLVTARNWRRIALWAAAALLVLIVAVLVLVQTEPVQQFLLRQAEAFARRAGAPVSAKSLRLNVFDLQVSLSGVVYDNGGVRAEVDSLTADLPWNIYRADGIVMNSLSADGVRVRLASREPAVPEPSGQPTRLPRIDIRRLMIRNGSFSYENESIRLEVPSFEIDAAEGKGTLRLADSIMISPETIVRVPEVPLELSPQSLRFGPLPWSIQYGNRGASGLADGMFRWSPSVAASVNFATDPFTLENWDGVVARGVVSFEDGILQLQDFRATRGIGEVAGSARISDRGKAARVIWNNFQLDPSGLRGQTSGQLDLNWMASDFTDISGNGRVTVNTRDYGRAETGVSISAGTAHLNVRAVSMGANINAAINTGLDRRLSGSFRATHRQYGLITAVGRVDGTMMSPAVEARVTADGVTYRGIGPLKASARASFKEDILNVSNLSAQLKQSTIPDGALTINIRTRTIDGAIPAIIAELGDIVEEGKGRIQSSATISGTIDDPLVAGTATSDGLDIGGTHIDTVEASGTLDGKIVEVTRLVARQSEGILEASGSVDLESEQTQGSLHVSGFEITQVRNFSGTVGLDADVSGSYRSPTANLDGEVADIQYGGQEHGSVTFTGIAQRDALNVRLQSSKYNAEIDGTLTLKAPYPFTAQVVASQSQIEQQKYSFLANGRAHVTGSLEPIVMNSLEVDDFTVAGEGVDLKADGTLADGVKVALIANLAEAPVPEDLEFGGQVLVDAVVTGTLDNLQVDGEARTANATIRAMQMPEAASVDAAIDFTRDRFEIREMRASYADARVTIDGSGTLRGTGDFTFEAENIRPEALLPERPLSGLLGISGAVQVKAPQLEAIEGHATVTQMELSARGVDIRQVEKGEISLVNQVATVKNLVVEGPETRASATGTANLKTGDLHLDLVADTDLRIVEGFVPDSSAYGRIESRVEVRGTTTRPEMMGFVNLTDAQFQISEPVLLFSGITAKIQLAGNRAEIQEISGELNGGKVEVLGGTAFSSGGLQDASILVSLLGTELEYPEGLQSEIAANLRLNGSSPALTISGNVNVLDALYREDISLREEVFQRLTPQEMGLAPTAETAGLAGQINLDVEVDTTGPVSVSNNVARVDLTGSFQVRGTLSDPVVLGRASTLEGGEVYFGAVEGAEAAAIGERRDRYIIERGTVDFNNPLRTEPTFDIEATHDLQVKEERYLIRLTVTGTPTDLRTDLTSDPYLEEPDIIAMLLTGRTFTELQGEHVAVAREQIVDYLSGQLTSRFFQGAGTALGLDTVTIEPATIAAEEDISARLTVGKDISRFLSLVYSQNLSGPRNQSWILNYSTLNDFVVRGINRPDQDEVRLELRHGLEFGGGPALPRRVAPRSEVTLNAVSFEGTSFPIKDLMKYVTKPGKPYSISRMYDDVRSLREFFASRGYADARIRADREVTERQVDASFMIEPGPKIDFVYRGFDVSEDIREEVLQVWVDGRTEATSVRESIDLILRHLRDRGYLEARVTAENEAQNPDERLYVFQIDSGRKFREPEWVWSGIEPLELTESAGTIMEDPEAIRERILFQLRGSGFLDATCTVPELAIENGRPRFLVSVDRGPQYLVSSVIHRGNTYFTPEHLTRVVILGPTPVLPPDETGAARPPETVEPLKPFPYTSEWVSIARRRVMTEYWQQGFNDVQINASTDYTPGSGRIEVRFDIREGDRQQISDVRIMGDEKTLRSHVLRYFKFSAGDPVDYTRINLTRKQLYDTGLFKRVDFELVPGPQGGYVAELNLNERAPWSVRYGFTVTEHMEEDDRDLGVSSELTYRNLLGTGITTGTTMRWDSSLREARLFGSFPVFLNKDVHSTVSLFRTRDTLPDSIANTWGFTLQQQWRLRDFYVLSYDYSYRRVSTFERDLADDDPEIENEIVPVARFNATLSRDTRDDILNATRGTFLSNSFDFAPPGVGSSVQYVKNYAQYLRFREVWRPNLIWASAYRLGLAHGFGGNDLVATDQFRAGGSTSLRAFAEDTLLPGNALFITNQELRYPLFWRFGVVGFFDVGNVYEKVTTTRIFRQRYSPGIGLRINTPFILLRADFGLNLWPRTGEDRSRFSFGIGQAF